MQGVLRRNIPERQSLYTGLPCRLHPPCQGASWRCARVPNHYHRRGPRSQSSRRKPAELARRLHVPVPRAGLIPLPPSRTFPPSSREWLLCWLWKPYRPVSVVPWPRPNRRGHTADTKPGFNDGGPASGLVCKRPRARAGFSPHEPGTLLGRGTRPGW